MTLNRRDFLRGIGVVGVPAILLPAVVLDEVEGHEEPALPLAAKARKLVDYVVTQKDHPRVRDYTYRQDPNAALVQIDEGGLTYTISKQPDDRLSIRFGQTEGQMMSSYLMDDNLDGILEHGFLASGVSALLPPEIQRLNPFLHSAYPDIAVMHMPGDRFLQKLYEHTLDTLIGVYEKKP